jgi:hypothetical protein
MIEYDSDSLYPIGVEAQFPADDENIALPGLEEGVTMFTVTYVRGKGINMRAVGVPGAEVDAFNLTVSESGTYCMCANPMIWHFTGIDGDKIFAMTTVDSHLGALLLQYPELLFHKDALDNWTHSAPGTMHELLRMVPVGEPLEMVVAETFSHLSDLGITDSFDAVNFDEVMNVNMAELVEKFFED